MKLSHLYCMQYLVSRYVKSGREVSHVVDPYLDLRDRFRDLVKLKKNLETRNFDVDVLSVASGYSEWWNRFRSNCQVDCGDDVELKKKLRAALLERADGLVSAMKLPNTVENVDLLSAYESTSRIEEVSSSEKLPLLGGPARLLTQLRHFLNTRASQHFSGKGIRLAPPYIVRPAIIEACNLDVERFPTVQEGLNFFCLPGTSLPSMTTCFIKKQMGTTNRWPIHLFSMGEEYLYDKNTSNFSQRSVFCLLNLYRDETEDEVTCQDESFSLLNQFLDSLPAMNAFLDFRNVDPQSLELYESSALRFGSENRILARYSRLGDYVSRRILLTYDNQSDAELKFLKMSFMKIDLSSVVDLLVANEFDK